MYNFWHDKEDTKIDSNYYILFWKQDQDFRKTEEVLPFLLLVVIQLTGSIDFNFILLEHPFRATLTDKR